MQFEVNGQAYFLHFVDDEGRWYLFEPSDNGIHRIPVYIDAQKWERVGRPDKASKIPN